MLCLAEIWFILLSYTHSLTQTHTHAHHNDCLTVFWCLIIPSVLIQCFYTSSLPSVFFPLTFIISCFLLCISSSATPPSFFPYLHLFIIYSPLFFLWHPFLSLLPSSPLSFPFLLSLFSLPFLLLHNFSFTLTLLSLLYFHLLSSTITSSLLSIYISPSPRWPIRILGHHQQGPTRLTKKLISLGTATINPLAVTLTHSNKQMHTAVRHTFGYTLWALTHTHTHSQCSACSRCRYNSWCFVVWKVFVGTH